MKDAERILPSRARFATAEGLEVEVPAGAEGLSPNQQVDVFRFLHRYKRQAAGRLVITVPTGPLLGLKS